LKQLESCYYVFPGASHNRFEHFLGVSHLAMRSCVGLTNSDTHETVETLEKNTYIMQVATLCHDL